MKLTITAASGKTLIHDDFVSLTTMTEAGEITILPEHVPIVTVVRPGVMRVTYMMDNKAYTEEYVTGGGVLTVANSEVTMIVESLDEEDALTLEEILEKKAEAEKLMQAYHDESPTDRDPQYVMELEYQYLKYAAMQEMNKKLRVK